MLCQRWDLGSAVYSQQIDGWFAVLRAFLLIFLENVVELYLVPGKVYDTHGEHTSPSNSGELAHLISSTLSTTIFCHRGHYFFIILSVSPPRNLAFH